MGGLHETEQLKQMLRQPFHYCHDVVTKAVSTPVPVANWTLATRALESGLRPHDDRPRTVRAQLN